MVGGGLPLAGVVPLLTVVVYVLVTVVVYVLVTVVVVVTVVVYVLVTVVSLALGDLALLLPLVPPPLVSTPITPRTRSATTPAVPSNHVLRYHGPVTDSRPFASVVGRATDGAESAAAGTMAAADSPQHC